MLKVSSVFQVLDDFKIKSEKIKMKLNSNKKGTISLSYSAVKDLASIAAASTRSEVLAIQRKLKLEMQKIKNSGADEAQIDEAIKKIKKVIKSADKKIGNLKIEERILKQKQLAESVNNKRLEEEFEKELKGKRKSRKIKEMTDVISSDDIVQHKKGTSFDVKINFNDLNVSLPETTTTVSIPESSADSEMDVKL